LCYLGNPLDFTPPLTYVWRWVVDGAGYEKQGTKAVVLDDLFHNCPLFLTDLTFGPTVYAFPAV